MTVDVAFLGLGVIVIAAFAIEAATGFGAMIIGLGIGATFYPVGVLLPIFVLLDVLLCGYLALRDRDVVDVRWLATRILPLMTVGLGVGVLIGLRAPEAMLRRLLGVFVLAAAARDLVAAVRSPTSARPLSAPIRAVGLLVAGVMHGTLATGGPALVYVLGHSELSKTAFRSTLAVVWVLFDIVLLATYTAAGRIGISTVGQAVALLPGLAVAFVLGEWAHHRLDERRFRIVVTAVLLMVGVALIF